jgi:hypothetical protein
VDPKESGVKANGAINAGYRSINRAIDREREREREQWGATLVIKIREREREHSGVPPM